MPFQHPTEEFVFNLCRGSFLSLWSYANPLREGSPDELCDILVVCDPHVVIFSVKYSAYQETDAPQVGMGRWIRKTVEASVRQVYGAERNLARATYVTRTDGQQGLPLPPLADRKVHRIAVGLGGRRLVPLPSKDYDRGFVHCFDDHFVEIALGELDTVSDFIAYLQAKEDLFRPRQIVMRGGEEDLLAVYLNRGRKFPETNEATITVPEGLWASLLRNAYYQRRVQADQASYTWDRLIEYFADHVLEDRMEIGGTLSENEEALRIMARESRFARRMLGENLIDFLDRAQRRELRARMAPSISGVTYVFLNSPPTYDRESRLAELRFRCLVARNEIAENITVVGIGVNVQPAPQGYAEDLMLLSCAEWTPELQNEAETLRQEFGFFRSPLVSERRVDEYPEE